MASNPLFILSDFFCILPMNFAIDTLGLKDMGKFIWEGRDKSWPSKLSQFSFAKLRQPTGQNFFLLSQRNFPISFKPKVAITEFFTVVIS